MLVSFGFNVCAEHSMLMLRVCMAPQTHAPLAAPSDSLDRRTLLRKPNVAVEQGAFLLHKDALHCVVFG